MACTDVGPVAPPTHLLKRGDWRKPGEVVAPGFLSAIDDREADLKANNGTTGRRAARYSPVLKGALVLITTG